VCLTNSSCQFSFISGTQISNNISPTCKPLDSAIFHSIGLKINQGYFTKSQLSIASSYVGINFNFKFVSILSFIQIGFTQTKKRIKKTKNASKKFIKTQTSKIIDCCQAGFLDRL
jgi:hypothetical protein